MKRERKLMTGEGGPRVVLGALMVALIIALASVAARSEEAGTGHYIPGATSSSIDMLPDRDASTLVYANGFTYYEGSAGATKDLEFGGLPTADAKGTVYSDTSLFLYQAPWKILGGQYAAELLVPYVWLKVQGDVALSGRKPAPSVHKEDTANGFGDIEIFPVMMGWKIRGL